MSAQSIADLKEELAKKLARDVLRTTSTCDDLVSLARRLAAACPSIEDIDSDFEDRDRPSTPAGRPFPTGITPAWDRSSSASSRPDTPSSSGNGGSGTHLKYSPPSVTPEATTSVTGPLTPTNQRVGGFLPTASSENDVFLEAKGSLSDLGVSPQPSRVVPRQSPSGPQPGTTQNPYQVTTANSELARVATPPPLVDPDPPRRPEDETFFSTAKHKFTDVHIDPATKHIPTAAFLDACECILPFIDRLGSTTFAPVRSDINGNITKLRNRFKTNPHRYVHLQGMVLAEVER